jgi:hypothetical protein
MDERRKRVVSVILALAMGLLLAVIMAACLPVTSEPLPSETPTQPVLTDTPTPTIVWFPPTPTTTPFPTPLITPTMAASPLAGELILEDDFSDPTQWTLGQTASTSVALGVAELTLALDHPGAYLYTLRQGTDLADFYLEISASPSLCRGPDEYGLLLRVSPSNDFYRFSLTCDGQLRLDKYYQGKASSPQPLMYSGAVPPGAPSSSRLGVWASGKEMRFYVNGEYQFTVNDPSLTSGGLGVFIRSNGENALTVSFSDLQVYEPVK